MPDKTGLTDGELCDAADMVEIIAECVLQGDSVDSEKHQFLDQIVKLIDERIEARIAQNRPPLP